jgi:hypothetical protein
MIFIIQGYNFEIHCVIIANGDNIQRLADAVIKFAIMKKVGLVVNFKELIARGSVRHAG